MRVQPHAVPVFNDASGRRTRRVRVAVGALCVIPVAASVSSPSAAKGPSTHANAQATAKPTKSPRSSTSTPNSRSTVKGNNSSTSGAAHAKKPSPSSALAGQ